ncbi:hypothetical protein AB0K48_26855, partial [Nonomuraea sp. NPDC055795]
MTSDLRDLHARPLVAGEAGAVLNLCSFDDVDASVVERELSAGSLYCWMGLYTPDGTPAALHRGLRWHRHLLLKGLFVADRFRESGVGLRAAFAIRAWARQQDLAGILAWIEHGRPESHLAQRLRLRPSSPLLHRYLLPLPCPPGGAARAVPATGVVTVPGDGAPMVKELLGLEQDDPGSTRLGWALDRTRLLLSGNPCATVADLPVLVEAAATPAAATGATGIEVLFEAADLHAAFQLFLAPAIILFALFKFIPMGNALV